MSALKDKPTLWAFAVLLGLLAAASTYAAPADSARVLTLDAYLDQVRAKHEGLRGASEAAEGARLRSEEGSLLLAPTLFANANLLDDRKPNPTFRSLSRTVNNTYSFGISKQFGLTGTTARLSYAINYLNLYGLPAALLNGASPTIHEAKPMIEITQPLLRNSFGWETRANQRVLEASALAAHHQNAYAAKVTLAQAEAIYWRLALARRNLAIQQDSLERGQKLYDWSRKRANLQLADQSDLLQAQANLDLRKLQTQAARDELRSASLVFNQTRGEATDTVEEKTAELEEKSITDFKAPERASPMRDDLRAAQQQEIAAIGRAEIGLSTETPTLELYGSYALNGQKTERAEAISQSFTNDLPTRAVGIRFSAPLDIGTVFDTREGYRKDRAAAELNYQRRAFEVEREWTDLNAKFGEVKRRLELTRSIEDVQKRKLTYERERLGRGRSTLYQVLLFEQDYQLAQFSRLQAQAEALQVVAQLRLFEASDTEKGN